MKKALLVMMRELPCQHCETPTPDVQGEWIETEKVDSPVSLKILSGTRLSYVLGFLGVVLEHLDDSPKLDERLKFVGEMLQTLSHAAWEDGSRVVDGDAPKTAGTARTRSLPPQYRSQVRPPVGATVAADHAEPTTDYFGVCPTCHKNDGCLNIGRTHVFVCHEHRVRWSVGSNLFSSWKDETQADWDANAKRICGYQEVKPYRDPAWNASTGAEAVAVGPVEIPF